MVLGSLLCFDNLRKIFVFIINCRVELWFWLSDFETDTTKGSARLKNMITIENQFFNIVMFLWQQSKS